jgi:hypothetical protein
MNNKYFQKYLKYKTKYKQLKFSSQKGGQYKPKNKGPQFFNRANRTILAGLDEIIFNLFLVKYKFRPAFLLELGDFPEFDSYELYDTINSTYKEFQHTIEYEIDQIPHRVFYHILPLPSRNKFDNHDHWVAECLGFNCKGIASEDKVRYSISYVVDIPKISITTEICDEKNFNRKVFEKKLKKLNRGAKLAYPAWKVQMIITKLRPSSLQYFLDRTINNELNLEDQTEILNLLGGSGLIGIQHNIQKNSYTFEDVIKNKKLLVFTILRAIVYPEKTFAPFTSKEDENLLELELLYSGDLDIDPVESYRKHMKKILNVVDTNRGNIREFKELSQEVIDRYQNLIKIDA